MQRLLVRFDGPQVVRACLGDGHGDGGVVLGVHRVHRDHGVRQVHDGQQTPGQRISLLFLLTATCPITARTRARGLRPGAGPAAGRLVPRGQSCRRSRSPASPRRPGPLSQPYVTTAPGPWVTTGHGIDLYHRV
jgi:hypothetical protein